MALDHSRRQFLKVAGAGAAGLTLAPASSYARILGANDRVRAAGYNANFLLNVGPMPNGKIQPEFGKTLRELGQWTTTYGESLYGTRGGPIPPRPWGVTTQKGNTVYIHVLEWSDEALLVQGLKGKVKSAKFVKNGAPVSFVAQPQGVILSLPAAARDDIDTVVALELQ